MSGKYFWLKLKKDFFKRHDIRIIESMPNGKDYILFYLKLLVESVDHDGNLRFSDTIPYNDEMLSVITNTNIDVVKSALEVFINLKMIEILDDQTIYMNEVEKLIGAETDWAVKKREYRTQKRQNEDNVLPLSDKRKSIEKEKELELDKELEKDIPSISPKEKLEPLFDEFWKLYPKKVKKKNAFAEFKKIKNIESLMPVILADVETKRQSRDWQKENGRFIPDPERYIKNERWNDVNEVAERQVAINEAVKDKIDDFYL